MCHQHENNVNVFVRKVLISNNNEILIYLLSCRVMTDSQTSQKHVHYLQIFLAGCHAQILVHNTLTLEK